MAVSSRTFITLKGLTRFDYDLDVLKPKIKLEGREIKKLAQRFVSRRAISKAGEFVGQRSGRLKKTINVRMMSGGLGVIVSHKMKTNEPLYPFMLISGVRKNKIKPRKDHIDAAFNARRTKITQVLRSSLRKVIKGKNETLTAN